jgi:hypothetical protein
MDKTTLVVGSVDLAVAEVWALLEETVQLEALEMVAVVLVKVALALAG